MFRHHNFRVFLKILPILFIVQLGFSQNTEKLAKEANTLFKADNFIEATPKYLQLLSLEPRNSLYNYRYGACLLYNQGNTGQDKKSDALKYLKFAVTDTNVDPEAHYYLARAYHLNYYFDRAIRSYLTYKGLVKDKTALKRDVDRQIEMCKNGQKLLSKVSEIAVKERKTAGYDDFFRMYNLKDIGGTILVTEDFQSKLDKKKNHRPTIHLPDEANIVFYSSFGETDDSQKDIYYRKRVSASAWSEPVRLPDAVNSNFDEDFPYLDPSGTYLYFSSKGHNSMGGYDVFRIPVNLENMKFGRLENMDFAISSPDDDLFYVVDQENKHAYFASARQSEGGKIHVFRVMVNRLESNAILFNGEFVSTDNPKNKNATIQIKELTTGRIIDELKPNPVTGALNFTLPRAGKYEFIVKTEQSKTPQVLAYDAPNFEDSRLLRMNFIEERNGDQVVLKLSQDDYYKFSDDERQDALAALFLAKAELKPNQQLAELVATQENITANTSNSSTLQTSDSDAEMLSNLNLMNYELSELEQLAKNDLEKLKTNLKTAENQKRTYLQYAADQIELAQKTEQNMQSLFEKAEKDGLTEKELTSLKNQDQQRKQHLANATLSSRLANEQQEKIATIQTQIAQADAMAQKMAELKNNPTALNNLNADEQKFIRENFNRIEQTPVTNNKQIGAINQRLQALEDTENQLEEARQEIISTQTSINEQKAALAKAKKKQQPEIEQKIAELETQLESLQRQERFLTRQNEKMLAERDSLKTLKLVYSESSLIDPGTVSASNNARLVEAKLKTENAKRIDQKTAEVLENVNVIYSEPVDFKDETANTDAEKLHNDIQKRAAELYEIDKSIEKLSPDATEQKLVLEKQKQTILSNQINDLKKLATLEEDNAAIAREIETHEMQLMVSENISAELEAARTVASNSESNYENKTNTTETNDKIEPSGDESEIALTKESNNEKPEKSTLTAAQIDTEISSLKNTYKIQNDYAQLDPGNSEHRRNMQQYQAGLTQLRDSANLDSEGQRKINEELNQLRAWFNEPYSPKQDENVTVISNERSTQQTAQTVSTSNEKAADLALNISALKSTNYELLKSLDETESKRKAKRIMKQIEKNDEKILQDQYKLLLTEKDDYARVNDSVQNLLTRDLKNNPLIKSEIYILQTKLSEAQEVLNVLDNTKRSDRERIVVQALDFRDDYIKQMNLTLSRIEEQKEIARIAEETGIDESWLTDQRKLDYTLANITEEIAETKERISYLKKNLSSYSKADQPVIQNDIKELSAHLEDMEKIKKDTQQKIQNRKINEAKVVVNPKLDNAKTDTTLLTKLPDSEISSLLESSDFLTLRNNLVSFNTLDIRLQNAQNRQKSLKNEIQAQINVISSSSEKEKENERNKLNTLIQSYKKTEADVMAIETEMNRIKLAIESNQTYQKNPEFFNTVAQSRVVQERLLTIAQPSEEVEIKKVQSAGIVFVNPENKTKAPENFALNPVNIPGMIYKIQIGAFNKPINLATFAEFDPVTTDQVGNSIRYSAGLFYTKAQAFTNLNPIKAMGYPDAFVVAYCDGVRYTVAEADELLRQGKCSLNANPEIMNMAAANTTVSGATSAKSTNYNKAANAAEALALEQTKGLLFTVQIGVYNTPRTAALLQNLEPLNTQLTEKNQIRYSVGRFDQLQEAIKQRDEVKVKGFNDAFVVAYFNGEKISIAEAQNILNSQGEMALFNRSQSKKINVPTAKIEMIQAQPDDTTEQIEYLSSHPVKYQWVSRKDYAKIPMDLIEEYRGKNIWVYYDPQSQKVLSSQFFASSQASDNNFELATVYQGFRVSNSEKITYQNLLGYQSEMSYYNLTMTWTNDLPQLIAFLLQQNQDFSIAEWNPTEKQIKFAPLNYVQKEKIKKSLLPYGDISFIEFVITF